jgi:hypothetical protein
MYSIDQLINSVQHWLTVGELDVSILANDFEFNSPFWKKANRAEFIEQFQDPTDYTNTALAKIIKFDPIVRCVSEDKNYFTITLTYHTRNDHSVTEVIHCRVNDGLIQKMVSIYDLAETKAALGL